jgi:cytochrome c oxidase cbb3-type subunit 1
VSFIASAFLYLAEACPRCSRAVDFTWFGFGVTQWQLLGFAGMILCGAIFHILPLIMQKELPQPKLAKLTFFLFGGGVLVYVVPLLIGGVVQGLKLRNADIPIAEVNAGALMFFRISTTGQLLILLASLCLLLNLFIMTLQWKLGLAKAAFVAITAPLESSAIRPEKEVSP